MTEAPSLPAAQPPKFLMLRLSIMMGVAFSVEAREVALSTHGKPEILNKDQGSQFTGTGFTSALYSNDIAWRDTSPTDDSTIGPRIRIHLYGSANDA